MPERPGRLGGAPDLDRDPPGWGQVPRRCDVIAPGDLGVMDAAEVDRGPGPPAEAVGRPVVPVQAPDADGPAGAEPFEVVAGHDLAGGDRPGDDRPVPGDRERTVDREAERSRVGPLRGPLREPREGGPEVVDPSSLDGRRADDRRPRQESPGDEVPDVLLDEVEPLGGRQVALGQGDEPRGEAEQAEDLQVLPGLGHHRVVGGDHQHRQVEPCRAREHVADEPLVAGDVDEGEASVAQFDGGEAQVDRDPPPTLVGEPVGVDAGQGPDQGRLAVVDVAGGPQHEVAGGRHGAGVAPDGRGTRPVESNDPRPRPRPTPPANSPDASDPRLSTILHRPRPTTPRPARPWGYSPRMWCKDDV
jgi:hypothetical protein